MNIVAEALNRIRNRERRELYRNDPGLWAEEYLGVKLWSKQREIGYSIVANRGTMVAASHSSGKSYSAALFVCWWIDVHDPDEVFVATTAPSAAQLRIIWDYVRKFHSLAQKRYEEGLADHPLPGYITGDNSWKMENGLKIGEGRKPPNEKIDSAFQGRHAPFLLAVIDEAVGVNAGFIEAIGNMATGEDNRQLMIANPTDLSSAMYKTWQRSENDPTSFWNRITISVLDSPLIKEDPYLPAEEASGMAGWDYYQQARETFGSEDDPRFLARVLGQWAQDSGDTVFTAEEIARAHNTFVRVDPSRPPELGCDIARMGCFDDTTEILTDSGWKLFENLTGGEQVLSHDLEGNVSEWMPITEVHKYPFEGDLNVYEGGRVSFAITDNHNLITTSYSQQAAPFKIRRFDEHKYDFKMKMTTNWIGSNPDTIEFVTVKPMPYGGAARYENTFDFGDWAEFLGWFISEGNVYVEKRENARYRVCISQNPGEKAEEIRALLTRMGLKFRYSRNRKSAGGFFEFTSKSIGEHLIEHCGVGAASKRIPDYMKNATPEMMDKFLVAFRKGDGSLSNKGSATYYSSSTRLIDDLQEMLAKLGRAGKIAKAHVAGSKFYIDGREVIRLHDTYALYSRQKACETRVPLADVRKVPYSGYVYCVSTPYHTIMVRRNGKVMWSGNSDRSAVYVKEFGEVWETDDSTGEPTKGTGVEGIRLRRLSDWVKAPIVNGTPDNPDTTTRVHELAMNNGARVVKVDASGIGASVIDGLAGVNTGGYQVVEIFGGATASDPRSYVNARAEQAFELKLAMQRGEVDLDPEDDTLTDELGSIVYERNERQVIKLESKDSMKRRGLRSPDFYDALIYAFQDVSELFEPGHEDRGLIELDDIEFELVGLPGQIM